MYQNKLGKAQVRESAAKPDGIDHIRYIEAVATSGEVKKAILRELDQECEIERVTVASLRTAITGILSAIVHLPKEGETKLLQL